MNLVFKKNHKVIINTLSFIIPILIMLLASIIMKISPFGEKSYILWDMNGQYIDFFSYYKTVFFSNNNFLYSFSSILGSNTIGFFAYYLLSPLNLITLLANAHTLPYFMMILIFLKLGLCGLTFSFYLRKQQEKFTYDSLIFSTSYALMAYNITYCYHLMWLDAVILLPLVIYGIDKIVEGKKPIIYIIFLAMTIIYNYYTGFMVCIFSVLYFVYKMALNSKRIIKTTLVFGVSSLTAGLLSLFVLLPTIISMQGGKASFSLSILKLVPLKSLYDIMSQLFTASYSINQASHGLPNLFCGVLIPILIALYIFNNKIKLKERIVTVIFLIVLVMCLNIQAFYLLFHGLNHPVGFPYRFSFIFSFLIIIIGYKSFKRISENNIVAISLTILGFIFAFYKLMTRSYEYYQGVNINYLILDIIMILIYLFLILGLIYKNKINDKKTKKVIVVVIISIIAFINGLDLVVNAVNTINIIYKDTGISINEYRDYITSVEPAIKEVQKKDQGFYRLEKNFSRTLNDSMQFNYHGISHFSSTTIENTIYFMEKLGFKKFIAWTFYDGGSTKAVDGLLGIKYILSYESEFRDYELVMTIGKINVFKNPYALSIGFGASSQLVEADINNKETNTFEFQNNILKSLVGSNYEDIYIPENNYQYILNNLKETKKKNYTLFSVIDPDQEASIEYQISVSRLDELYLYFNSDLSNNNVKMYINEVYVQNYFGVYNWAVEALGKHQIGDTVLLKFVFKDGQKKLKIYDNYFYYEDSERLNEAFNILLDENVDLKKITSSHLKGRINIDEDKYLVFTIPYDNGWQVRVDGQKVETIKVFDTLMAIPISKGEHIMELKYIPKGLKTGSMISLGTLILFIYYALKR